MNIDWKDALAGLKDSGTLPEGDAPEASAPASDKAPASKSRLNIFYEKKGRAGKPATIITGFSADDPEEAASVASQLKKRLGCGGSARGGEILLQGDRREQVRPLLASLGYKC